MVYVLIAGYVICAVLCYGILLAWTREPYSKGDTTDLRSDMGAAALVSLGGPVTLVIVFCLSGLAQPGLKFR